MADNTPKTKARYWTAVMYQENMRPDWREVIDDLLQCPYAYCEHDMSKDSKSEHRKNHVHILLVFANTTTYQHAFSVFARLNGEGKEAFNKIESVINIRHMYDYLIHATESCKKKGKERYAQTCRVCGNNFDIGAYEQLGQADKDRMLKEICDYICKEGIGNFADLYLYVMSNMGEEYFEVVKTHRGLLERLCKGIYLNKQKK